MQGQADAVIGYAILRVVVGADLFRAVAGFDLAATLGGDGGLLFLLLHFVETGAENTHGLGAILDLRFFVLLRDDQAAGNVRDTHCRVRGVHGLAAGAGRAKGIDAQVFGFDFDVDVVGFRQDRDGGRGRVNTALLFGGGNALDAVHAAFVLQLGINFVALNGGDDFFHSALRRRRAFEDFDFPALRFGVAGIHAEEIAGKKSGFVAAGARANFDDNALFVVGIFREQQELELALDGFLARGELLFFVVGELLHLLVVSFEVQLVRAGEVFVDLLVLAMLGDDFLKLGVLLGDFLEARRIGDKLLRGE